MESRHHLPETMEALHILGLQLAAARRTQRRTAADVAERVGISRVTLRRIERGDPATAIGLYLETAAILGVPLLGASRQELAELSARAERDLALLPARVRTPLAPVDDDF